MSTGPRLSGEDHQITEFGTGQLFLYWMKEDGNNPLKFHLCTIVQAFSKWNWKVKN
jgi:hypothetical protein